LKHILVLFLVLALASIDAFARAGSSYSRSSSHSSYSSPSRSSSSYSSGSSSSYSRTQSYSGPTPTYSRPASVAPRPTYSRPAPVTVNRTTNNYSSNSGGNSGSMWNRNNNNNNDNGGGNSGGGGMGIMGTIAGVGGGIVVGNLLTSALMGDHRNEGHAPAGGYASTSQGYPVAGQPVAPAMAGATTGNYVTDGSGGFVPAPTATELNPTSSVSQPAGYSEPHSTATLAPTVIPDPWYAAWYMWLLYIISGIALLVLLYRLYQRWQVARLRSIELAEMLESERNLSIFRTIFIRVQTAYASGSNMPLIHLTTSDMYDHIQLAKSNTEDEGLINVVDDVTVLSIITTNAWEEDGISHQQAKIRFSMIDYTVDSDGTVTHGSKSVPETSVEYWDFQSNSTGSWVLAHISQHPGHVHQG
jgi:hypothetical protein